MSVDGFGGVIRSQTLLRGKQETSLAKRHDRLAPEDPLCSICSRREGGRSERQVLEK